MRAVAAAALGAIGDARAVDPLITALTDQDKQVRAAAASGLGSIKDARAIGPLISALPDDDPGVWTARNALAQSGASAVEPLIAALGDKDWTIRRGAAQTLGDIGDTRAIEPLTAAARARRLSIHKDRYTAVRRAAADALAQIKERDARSPAGLTARTGVEAISYKIPSSIG